MMEAIPLPFPLFDSVHLYRQNKNLSDGPVRKRATEQLSLSILKFDDNDWSQAYLEIADDFLKKYINDEKTSNTFNRFKSEIERYTLWLVLIHKKNPLEIEERDISAYLEWLGNPTRSWVSTSNTQRLIKENSVEVINSNWRPFWARYPKNTKLPSENTKRRQMDKSVIRDYKPSSATIAAATRALSPFYKYLIYRQLNEERKIKATGVDYGRMISKFPCIQNPVDIVAKDYRRNQKNKESYLAKGVEHRLTQQQWGFILEALKEAREQDDLSDTEYHKRTRAWFLLAFMKGGMLRISEVCRSELGNPVMGDIKEINLEQDDITYWEYHLIGKGGKKREVILPDELVNDYLKEYRAIRKLSPELPVPDEKSPLIASLRQIKDDDKNVIGESPISIATASEIVQDAFDLTVEYIKTQEIVHKTSFKTDIEVLKQASTHWLRHTAASMALEDGENLKDVSDTLGHADQRTTDMIYNRREDALRAQSAKKRRI